MDAHQADPGPVSEALRALGLEPQGLEPLGVAAWNAHFRLELEGVLQHLVIYRLPDPTAIAGLRFEQQVLRALAASGFERIPTPVVVQGESLFPYAGGWFAITRWVEGCRGDDDPPVNAAQRAAMAEGLAALHQALAPLDARLDFHPDHVFVYPLSRVIAQRHDLIARLESRLPSYGAEAQRAWEAAKPTLEGVLEGFPLELYERTNPRGVVHGDFRALNAAFRRDELTCLLDFNCSFNEARLWDVAYTALGLGGKETIGLFDQPQRSAEFVAAYHAASPLSAAEWELLPHMLAFVPAKLMLSAVADWWITDRGGMLSALAHGEAATIAALASGGDP